MHILFWVVLGGTIHRYMYIFIYILLYSWSSQPSIAIVQKPAQYSSNYSAASSPTTTFSGTHLLHALQKVIRRLKRFKPWHFGGTTYRPLDRYEPQRVNLDSENGTCSTLVVSCDPLWNIDESDHNPSFKKKKTMQQFLESKKSAGTYFLFDNLVSLGILRLNRFP